MGTLAFVVRRPVMQLSEKVSKQCASLSRKRASSCVPVCVQGRKVSLYLLNAQRVHWHYYCHTTLYISSACSWPRSGQVFETYLENPGVFAGFAAFACTLANGGSVAELC